jgi:DHA1 family inner membrane transport protein
MSEQAATVTATPRQLAWQVGVTTLGRLFLNTSRRFVYPFAPVLGRGLGVPLTYITSIIAANQATGLLGPVFGPLGDRWGYRVMMLAGLSLMAVGMIGGGLLPFYGVVLLALFLAGLGKSIYDPAIQAYVGERVPYHRRAMVIGIVEFAWAGSSLIGIPLTGLLIERLGWRAPFFVLGGLGLLGVVAIRLLIPPDRHHSHQTQKAIGFREAWRLLGRNRAALGALAYGFFIGVSNDNLFVVYGAWLESAFALSVVALGTATTTIGLAEFLGEILTASISDRIGLKRAVMIGLSLSALSYMLLPVISQTLPLALLALFILFLTFEYTVVTSFSLITEVLPGARGTMMASFLATTGLGRVIGALIGGPIWLAGGLVPISLVSGGLTLLAAVCLGWGLWHWRDHAS